MKAVDVAKYTIGAYGDTHYLTIRKINILLYYIQCDSLRRTNKPLFNDEILATENGIVIPNVCNYLSQNYGNLP